MKANDKLKAIQLLIKEHLEEISGKDTSPLDKELSYSMIQDEIYTMVKYYNGLQDKQQRKSALSILMKVQDELFDYLAHVNYWDKNILDLYKLLVSTIYNID